MNCKFLAVATQWLIIVGGACLLITWAYPKIKTTYLENRDEQYRETMIESYQELEERGIVAEVVKRLKR